MAAGILGPLMISAGRDDQQRDQGVAVMGSWAAAANPLAPPAPERLGLPEPFRQPAAARPRTRASVAANPRRRDGTRRRFLYL
jgi:hypothetical protein